MDNSLNDFEWLKTSSKRTEKTDPDFEISSINDESPCKVTVPRSCMPFDSHMFLVCEQNLKELMKFCSSCGSPISSIDRKQFQGTNVNYAFTCLLGCETKWSTQPKIDAIRGKNF